MNWDLAARTIKISMVFIPIMVGSLLFGMSSSLVTAQEATPESPPGDGVISGIVTNSTTGSAGEGTLVTLSVFNEEGFIADLRTTTDSDGQYTFDGLNTDPALTYSLTASNESVGYSSGPQAFDGSSDDRIMVDIEIFDSTRDRELISVTERALIMTSISPTIGQISLLDVVNLQLEGDRAFVADDEGRSVEFPVPRNATEVTPFPGSDFNLGNATIESATVFAATPLLPGTATATLGYTIPYTNDRLGLELVNAYHTDEIRILIPITLEGFDEGLSVSGSSLTEIGQETIGPQTYNVWTADESDAGSRTPFAYQNLPQSSVAPNTLKKLEPTILALIALIGAVAVIGFVVYRRELFRARPVTLAPAIASSLNERRSTLVEQLRALESAREQDLLEDEDYVAYRRTILEHLRSISRQQQGLGADE